MGSRSSSGKEREDERVEGKRRGQDDKGGGI